MRTVIHGEALAWLAANPAAAGMSVVTSLPDVSEMPRLDLVGWREWFVGAARAVVRWIPEQSAAIFFQSDIRHRGAIVDKGYLVTRAAEEEGASVVWHKIVCRRAAGTASFGRPGWSHMICLTKGTPRSPRRPQPDVLPDAGFMPWTRSMGRAACEVACRHLIDETSTDTVVDPFCGHGTVLAVANELGLRAIGVDLSAKCCRKARSLELGQSPSARKSRPPSASGGQK